MTLEQPRCGKCQGTMELGHIPDTSRNRATPSAWLAGPPESRSFFLGIQWKADLQIPLSAFRCTQCAFVEIYAKR
jgi:hypothetical protein